MAEYVVKGAEPNETVLHSRTPNGYEAWHWLPVRERIVRCRDCKHAQVRHLPNPITGLPAGIEDWLCDYFWNAGIEDWRCDYFWNADELPEVEPDGFCAWGERKEVDA